MSEVQKILCAPKKANPLAKPHDWKFVRVLHNGTKFWRCSKCGGESWTLCNNEGPHVCRPPDTEHGDLENSGTPEDCDEALVLNLMTEKTFGHK